MFTSISGFHIGFLKARFENFFLFFSPFQLASENLVALLGFFSSIIWLMIMIIIKNWHFSFKHFFLIGFFLALFGLKSSLASINLVPLDQRCPLTHIICGLQANTDIWWKMYHRGGENSHHINILLQQWATFENRSNTTS